MSLSNHDHRAHKKAQFTERTQTRNNRTIVLVAVVGLAVVAGLYLFSTARSAAQGRQVTAANVSQGVIAIPLADLDGGQAKFFDYVTTSNKPIRFFAIKSSDGVYRAAADACDVCFRSKMGYHQEGDDMVCKKCGRHFPSKDVNVITGGCNPDGVPATVQGNKLLIATADLDARARLF